MKIVWDGVRLGEACLFCFCVVLLYRIYQCDILFNHIKKINVEEVIECSVIVHDGMCCIVFERCLLPFGIAWEFGYV